MTMKTFLAIALIVAAGAAQLLAGENAGRRAPGFALPDSSMQYRDLNDYRGKVVLLDFMKTSCPHCIVLAKTLDRVKKKYGSKIVVLSVVLPPDTTRTVKTFLADNNLDMTVLFDCGQMTASYVRPSPQNPSVDFPYLFVIDPKSVIYDAYQPGDQTKAIFEADGLDPIIDKLLGGAATQAQNASPEPATIRAASVYGAFGQAFKPACPVQQGLAGE